MCNRFFASLDKEQRKKSPNQETLKMYMDLDYPNRREFLKSTNHKKRTAEFTLKYPVFQDHKQVSLYC